MHAHPPRHTPHAHHAHTYIYATVYTYTHCDPKVILQNFVMIK